METKTVSRPRKKIAPAATGAVKLKPDLPLEVHAMQATKPHNETNLESAASSYKIITQKSGLTSSGAAKSPGAQDASQKKLAANNPPKPTKPTQSYMVRPAMQERNRSLAEEEVAAIYPASW